MSSLNRLRGAAAPIAATARVVRIKRATKIDRDDRLDLVGHLDELRRRLLISSMTMLVTAIVAFIFREHLIEGLTRPLNGVEPVTLGVAEPFTTAIKISLMTAFAVSLPVLMWQVWSFIAPACEKKTRRTVFGFVLSGSLLFAAGVAFGYVFALPSAVNFLTNFDSQLYDVQVRAQEYLVFAGAVLVSVGAVFQLPVILLGLVRFRVLSHGVLKKYRRVAYVLLALLAVLLPGVDPVTTTMWIVPLFILYESTVLIAKVYEKRLAKQGLDAEPALERKLRERREKKAAKEAEEEAAKADIIDIRRKLGLDVD